MKENRLILSLLFAMLATFPLRAQHYQYVDPRIGSEGLGRVFVGPSMPFGMVKPGPDCTTMPNAGWAPMPETVEGFSQVHVSGTGGGQKYGNILLQPYLEGQPTAQRRKDEDIQLGYYAATYENDIRTEITTADRCALYRIAFPDSASARLLIDCGWFLGKHPMPDRREAQMFVGGEVELVSPHDVRGYTRIRGGWNNGDAYTVYFWLTTDAELTTSNDKDLAEKIILKVNNQELTTNLKIGISFISERKARANIIDASFDEQLNHLRQTWEKELKKIDIETETEADKRMFYTALYHTMIMPVDRTDENPKWTDAPYYDDYYAIWDTYRTSTPLITLLDPDRERDLINSLLNIYRREGYMPDARSGNCNGRTQGGSNAEVMIADAYTKGLQGINYELALQAMLKDATVPPGGNEEKEGRGGLEAYRRLGYIPYGIDRAGNRTIEYAYDDYCISLVAEGLGHHDVAQEYAQKAQNWRNLWRSDYEWDDMRGFIMPKDEQGRWLDSVPWGHSKVYQPKIIYTPVTKVAPWYLPWWSTFFYEATSEEYSLSIPHDVEGLIQACGGPDLFRQRLDLFFEKNYYNVANEPSFLTPCLYHWLGRPDLSTQRIHHIIRQHYDDRPDGLPGNDDSGAMSSWLAFHLLGFYPNAGQPYYLLNVPLVKSFTLHLSNGKDLRGERKGRGMGYKRVTLNGKELTDARITHEQLIAGGRLIFETQPSKKIQEEKPKTQEATKKELRSAPEMQHPMVEAQCAFTLNRQYRTWPLRMAWDGDTLNVVCKETSYRIPRHAVDHASAFCWHTPQADGTTYHDVAGTFGFVSRDALQQLQTNKEFRYDGITWRLLDRQNGLLHVRADIDFTEMWIDAQQKLPLVVRMKNNPLGIDWELSDIK